MGLVGIVKSGPSRRRRLLITVLIAHNDDAPAFVQEIIYLFDLLGLRLRRRCTMEEHGKGIRAICGIPMGRALPKYDQSTHEDRRPGMCKISSDGVQVLI